MLSRPTDREPTAATLHAHRYIFSVLVPGKQPRHSAHSVRENEILAGPFDSGRLVLIYRHPIHVDLSELAGAQPMDRGMFPVYLRDGCLQDVSK